MKSPSDPYPPGSAFPLGATVGPEGVNFSVYSKNAAGVELLLFDRADDARPARIIPLEPDKNRTYFYWHVFVPGLLADRFTATASRALMNRKQGSVLTVKRCCSIPTARPW